MTNVEKYKIYLIEQYLTKNNLAARNVYNIFKNCGIFEYIERTFEAIHTMSDAEVLLDIDKQIAEISYMRN